MPDVSPPFGTIASPVFTGDAQAVTPGAGDNDTSIATTAFVRNDYPLAADWLVANSDLASYTAGGVVGQAALTPTFYPVDPDGARTFSLSAFQVRVKTAGTNTPVIGAALYSVTFGGVGTVAATLVAQLNASISGAAAGNINGAVTAGTASSGAGTVSLDFNTNRYFVGTMGSEVGTLACAGNNFAANSQNLTGTMRWSAAARASVTDWPASFTQTSVSAINTSSSVWHIVLLSPTGQQYL